MFSQMKNALELALLMLDKENQLPQFTPSEAFKAIRAAHGRILDSPARASLSSTDRGAGRLFQVAPII